MRAEQEVRLIGHVALRAAASEGNIDGEVDFYRTAEKTVHINDPTQITYRDLGIAYDFFNVRLFGGWLPPCLLTLQRWRGAYGYFAKDRFSTFDGTEVTDEIALNPVHFRSRTLEENLSTLVHEQVHLAQRHFGKAAQEEGYHNQQWRRWMWTVGLVPSSTGAPGGKQTGYRMSHYILPGGPFDRACQELLSRGFTIRYVERPAEPERSDPRPGSDGIDARRRKRTESKAASKTRYICPGPSCRGVHVWGKPAVNLIHADCGTPMIVG